MVAHRDLSFDEKLGDGVGRVFGQIRVGAFGDLSDSSRCKLGS
jgi:hypothetical protein